MNEIEREFNTDVKQKKSIARGAYARKNGSKSKKCSLPSDNLTDAQMRKLNGPVASYAINKPMGWAEFKKMPLDLQHAHIAYIQSHFEVGVAAIEKFEFALGPTTLRTHLQSRGITFRRFQGRTKYEDFIAWVEGERALPEVSEPETKNKTDSLTEFVATEPEHPKEDTSFADLRDLPKLFCGGKLCLSGKADEVIPNLLTLIGSNEAWLSVHLSFTRKDD